MRINKEGYTIIAVTAGIAVAVSLLAILLLPLWLGWTLCGAMLLVLLFVAAFFREPERAVVREEGVVFAPADGTVVVIEQVAENEFLAEDRIQVSVFMSLSNVHINWFPVGGRVVYFRHHHGKYMVAWHPKSSEDNERTTTVVDTGRHTILFRQIAGLIARRIVSYAEEGKSVGQNDKCGFIKFGSRVDLMLPVGSEILVSIGDKVTGSQTPIARLPQ
ncbi:phosphatidylserine decarboxylase family protein [Gallalistipes aquisgranensis]|uniref:phosphatidylserine decarboxylase family protein n=1 Tax=Gallalistipes aquisgranensis TaxID=2779358 RepID=UPI001CF9221E|nr:phosphatidylserine decarboxylase family protein [Gallalistipes aquisgranensis]MBE5034210.1 phosphatidylserine decarboxylase family protein [Gallalistipes aquisgranensis]